jgi:hypothetical protein
MKPNPLKTESFRGSLSNTTTLLPVTTHVILLHRTEEATEELWPDIVLVGMTLSLERSANSSMNEHTSNALARQAVA